MSTFDRRRLLAVAGIAGVAGACGTTTRVSRPAAAPTADADADASAETNADADATESADAAGPAVALLPADPELHLIRRATYGLAPGLLDEVRAGGAEAWLEAQLAAAGPENPELEDLLAGLPMLAMDAVELAGLDEPDPVIRGTLQAATLFRRWLSRHQLRELLVEFWSDHLNVDASGGIETILKVPEDREVIRPHALGRFDELLVASASSPAMLVYLDNARSRADGAHVPNENYARELLELHTVGVDGGYDESDVVAVARLLSGWSVDRRTGRFTFIAEWHGATGEEAVLGWSAAGRTGRDAGESFLRHLAHHPATARHLATKLCRRFVADDPPADLVATAAEVYLANDTAIVPVLAHIFAADAFAASIGQKVRRPAEFVVAALRATGARLTGDVGPVARALVLATMAMGHAPMAWPPPTGYPDVAAAWVSSAAMLSRWNATQTLFFGPGRTGPTGLAFETSALLGATAPATPLEATDQLAHQLLGHPLGDRDRQAIADHLAGPGAASDPYDPDHHGARLDQAAALVLQSPAFHLR